MKDGKFQCGECSWLLIEDGKHVGFCDRHGGFKRREFGMCNCFQHVGGGEPRYCKMVRSADCMADMLLLQKGFATREEALAWLMQVDKKETAND